MLQSKEFVQPKFLAKVFKQICKEKYTGVFQTITKKAEVLSFDIKDGKVASIRYKTKRNKEALQAIGIIEKAKYAFYERAEVKKLFTDSETVTNRQVLQYLLGKLVDSSLDSEKANIKDDNYQLSDLKKTLVDETMKDLKQTLSDHIGPILGQETFAKAIDFNTAISMLKNETPDVDYSQSFEEEADQLLIVENEGCSSSTYNNNQLGDLKKTLTDETMKELKKILTGHIGPISGLVCGKVFAKTANVNAAISMLEKEIPDRGRAQSFKEETKHLLVVE